jgi:hypothetical protein
MPQGFWACSTVALPANLIGQNVGATDDRIHARRLPKSLPTIVCPTSETMTS